MDKGMNEEDAKAPASAKKNHPLSRRCENLAASLGPRQSLDALDGSSFSRSLLLLGLWPDLEFFEADSVGGPGPEEVRSGAGRAEEKCS
eukprot:6556865-Karenia_brevis.AAC.1